MVLHAQFPGRLKIEPVPLALHMVLYFNPKHTYVRDPMDVMPLLDAYHTDTHAFYDLIRTNPNTQEIGTSVQVLCINVDSTACVYVCT